MRKFHEFMEKFSGTITVILLILVSVCLLIQNSRVFNYRNYSEKVETLLDSIYVHYPDFSDTIVEMDCYSDYSEAYIKLW